MIEVSVLIAVIGCFVGLAGWLTGRDKKISTDSEWKGQVNAKLDAIMEIKTDVATVNTTLTNHGERIKAAESSVAQAHHRIDEIRERLDKEKSA